MRWKCSKIGFLEILGVETKIFIFLDPDKHILGPKHAFRRITRPNRSTCWTTARSRKAKKWRSAAIFYFQFFFIFEHTALLAFSSRLYMPNLMMIGLTVQKLLTFLFSIGNALRWPKIGVFGPLKGENLKVKLFNPQKAHVYTIPRLLSHFGWESVHAFDQDAFPRNKKKSTPGRGFAIFHHRLEKPPPIRSGQNLARLWDSRSLSLVPIFSSFD